MRLLLTNDDGIDAPGLAALERIAARLGEAAVVAPLEGSSGCGHQVTTHRPLRVDRRGERRWAVAGWPADCTRVALRGLALGADWVLSGINAGGNLGADVHISGTVAAAREAALLGVPAVALSHYKRRHLEYDWEAAASWVLPLLRELLARPLDPGAYWNVNLPHLEPGSPPPEVAYCFHDPCPLPVRFREEGGHFHYDGDYHGRPRREGSDVDACLGGRIAVSLLRVG
jgi:5'-nucleotidase